jgi:hypothetical protein
VRTWFLRARADGPDLKLPMDDTASHEALGARESRDSTKYGYHLLLAEGVEQAIHARGDHVGRFGLPIAGAWEDDVTDDLLLGAAIFRVTLPRPEERRGRRDRGLAELLRRPGVADDRLDLRLGFQVDDQREVAKFGAAEFTAG